MGNELPGELAPPLHILEPLPLFWLGLLAALMALLVWLVVRRRRREKTQAPSARPLSMPSSLPAFEVWIRELESKHLEARSYREGCIELIGAARQRWQQKGDSLATMRTAKEIRWAFGDSALSRFLLTLADLRFRRQEPDEKEFQAVCSEAIAVHQERSESAPK